MVLCGKQCLASIFLFFYLFLGLKTFEKNPTGQQVTGLSSLAHTKCIPVRCKAFCCSPNTMTRSITAGSQIVWFLPALYNASIHLSHFPLTGTPISGLTWKEQDWHFSPDHIPGWTSHQGSFTRLEEEWRKTMLGGVWGILGQAMRSGILDWLYFGLLSKLNERSIITATFVLNT